MADRRSRLRDHNEQRSQEDFVRGPAREDQGTVPVIDALSAHHQDAVLPSRIPAHQKEKAAPRPAVEALGRRVFANDVSRLHGLDNRHKSWQVRSAAERLFAQALGAQETLFSTNGSTTSVHTAMHAVAGPGDKVAIARNAHLSVVTGFILTGALPVWVEPSYDDDAELAHGVTPSTLAAALEDHPDVKAAIVTTPTFYGVSSDVAALADICHNRGIPLVVDGAWGLAYSFHPDLPPSALESGADIAIGSLHKTIGGLGQTSVISVQGEHIDRDRFRLALALFESTSTSTVLLASIDAARHQMVHHGQELIGESLRLAGRLRREIAQIESVRLMSEEHVLRDPSAHGFNPQHVCFDVTPLGLTGYEAGDWLRDQAKVAAEVCDHRRIMFLVTIGHDDGSIDRLLAAVRGLAEAHRVGDGSSYVPRIPKISDLPSDQVLSPRDAFFAPATSIELNRAAGHIAAEYVTPYPPGIPLLVPGERVSAEVVEYLDAAAAAGVTSSGASDPSLRRLRVVA